MTGNSRYIPQPIPIEEITLGEHLDDLVEDLSRHAHDLWAQQRLSDGWTWGDQRNDELKHHPCLVEYDELPESEKVYDRKLVTGTLKAIVALGYAIETND